MTNERPARLAVLVRALEARLHLLQDRRRAPGQTDLSEWDHRRIVDAAIRQASDLDLGPSDDLDFGTPDEDAWLR